MKSGAYFIFRKQTEIEFSITDKRKRSHKFSKNYSKFETELIY